MPSQHPVSLVTGAASGIGAACARRLAANASAPLILVDRDSEALNTLADALIAEGRAKDSVRALAFDVADEARWAEAEADIANAYGRLDWVIANAGVADSAPLADMSFAAWRRVLSVNLDGVFLTLRAAMRLIQDGGAIVVMASAAGLKAEPGIGAYSASKAGALQLMRVAAKEGAPRKVRVNALAPGGVETPIWSSQPWFQTMAREAGSERAAFDKLASMATPLGRYASAEEIARMAHMLLADSAPITGAALVVDGGYTL